MHISLDVIFFLTMNAQTYRHPTSVTIGYVLLSLITYSVVGKYKATSVDVI